MASRVVWLVANGHVEPDQVLGLTFTRKAATELAERIARRLRRLRHVGLWTPDVEEDGAEVLGGTPTVSTYHSYAGRLVREHVLRLGIEPESRLLSEAAAWQFAAEVVERYDGPMDDVGFAASTVTAAVVDLAGEMAEHLLGPDDVEGFVDAFESRVAGAAQGGQPGQGPHPRGSRTPCRAARAPGGAADRAGLPRPQAQPRRARLRRPDGPGRAPGPLVPDIGAAERARFRAVLLDEFQDTCEAQLVLLRHLYVAAGAPVPRDSGRRPQPVDLRLARRQCDDADPLPAEFADDSGRADVLPLSTSWRNDDAILRRGQPHLRVAAAEVPGRGADAAPQARRRPGAGAGRPPARRPRTRRRTSPPGSRQHWLDGRRGAHLRLGRRAVPQALAVPLGHRRPSRRPACRSRWSGSVGCSPPPRSPTSSRCSGWSRTPPAVTI